MKNLVTSIIDDSGTPLAYAHLLRQVIERAPQSGLTLSAMRDRMPILEKVLAAGTDADFGFSAEELTLLNDLYGSHPWGGLHPDLVALGTAVQDAATRPRD